MDLIPGNRHSQPLDFQMHEGIKEKENIYYLHHFMYHFIYTICILYIHTHYIYIYAMFVFKYGYLNSLSITNGSIIPMLKKEAHYVCFFISLLSFSISV